ncbi:hypothetical protein WR25_14974 isoform B [Diploscapter pachys]|uniref:PCI domain-containing protein 2 homolog n=1 Tax=Diploscapter pachys TaxID=2018661 RepID=A0A2A2LS97_9BILA|nr:hypothetical protein WR25_14974 isoform B [Diploscapter pachys]
MNVSEFLFQIMQVFNKEVIQKKKEENWFMPIFYQLCTDLRTLAKKVDDMTVKEDDDEGETETTYYEQSASYIMEAFRACVSDVRNDPGTSKKVAILNMTNQLFRIYFKINKLNLLKPLIRAVENAQQSGLYDSFSMADKVSFNYFLGRKAMFDAKLALAESSLLYAFRNCPPEYVENKRRILIYLIPVKMFLGQMPKKELLHKYELDQFVQIVEAVRIGNVKKLDEALWRDEAFFIQCGIYLMLEKLRAIAFRKLFKFCSVLMENHMIHLDVFLTALRLQNVTDIDCDELECIIANLIYDGRIKGYLSHQHKKLVLSKKEAFPPLSSIYM